MKIDLVLTACDTNDHYLKLFPYIIKVWKQKFNIDCQLVLIANDIPSFLIDYKDNIVLFRPIEGIHTAFISQVIRILYPCLYDNKNILITDVDIFPISYNYFIKSIENLPDNVFVSYRDAYIKQNMLGICYNVANSSIWKEIFNINNIDELIIILKKWYDIKYTGQKNCTGWFTDQQKLFEYVMNWKKNNDTRFVLFNDKNMNFHRLDKRQKNFIINNFQKLQTSMNDYTDFHSIKPYSAYKKIIEILVDAICNS